jgi:hypothetical protein
MPVDWNRALERAAELKDQGYREVDCRVSRVSRPAATTL